MTRSQRLKQQQIAQQQQIEGQRPTSMSAQKPKATRSRTSRRNSMITSMDDAKEPSNEFRNFVQTMLDSPQNSKQQSMRKPMVVAPSPRVERITIANKKNQQMEFLIPPKENDSALEIREQIRAALYSPDPKEANPETAVHEQVLSQNNLTNKLSNSNETSSKEKNVERISRLLIFIILSILTAVFIACYQDEIINFLQPKLKISAQFANECWDASIVNLNELRNVIEDKATILFAKMKEIGTQTHDDTIIRPVD